MTTDCDGLVRQLHAQFSVVTEMYEGLGDRCLAAGLKGKKRDKAHENFAWNARVIQGQMDLLEACRRDCKQRLQQVGADGRPTSQRARPLVCSSAGFRLIIYTQLLWYDRQLVVVMSRSIS